MKRIMLKSGIFSLLMAGSLCFVSCGDKNKETETDTDIDTTYVEGDNMNDMDTGTDTVTVNPDTIMGP